MKAFSKNAETQVITAKGVAEGRFVAQFNKDKHPMVRLYERRTGKNGVTIHKKIGEFYKMRRAVQRAWSLSNEE